MGHQVNFYLDPADTIALEQRLRTLGPLLVLHSDSPRPEPRIVEGFGVEEAGKPWLFYYIVRPDDLNKVVTIHVPAQGYWDVDFMKSPVIKFTRCFFDGTILRRGRLYCVDGFYDANNQWQAKEKSFQKWARAALAQTKKALKKLNNIEYIGTGAEAWLASSGGKLVT